MYQLKTIPEDFIVEEVLNIENGEHFFYYLLEKENWNTESALLDIARKNKLARKHLGFAGAKDKKAITKQYISSAKRLKECETPYKLTYVKKGKSKLCLGDLKGNKFSITVRNILKKPKNKNFTINYFGKQRFSKQNTDIGLAILKKDFEKAVRCLSSDFSGTDFIGKLKETPFHTLKLYLHSVQSMIWNDVAKQIIQKEQKHCLEISGDLIFSKEKPIDRNIPFANFDLDTGEYVQIIDSCLEELGINRRSFIIKSIPAITPYGGSRNLVSNVQKIRISELEKDELNKNMKKLRINFFLSKGAYATVYLEDIFSEITN